LVIDESPINLYGGIAINPITWTRTEKLATSQENMGSIGINCDGFVAVDQTGNIAIVKTWMMLR
jgi:hypothetical protein